MELLFGFFFFLNELTPRLTFAADASDIRDARA